MLVKVKNKYLVNGFEDNCVIELHDDMVIINLEDLDGEIPDEEIDNLYALTARFSMSYDGKKTIIRHKNKIISYGIETMMDKYISFKTSE